MGRPHLLVLEDDVRFRAPFREVLARVTALAERLPQPRALLRDRALFVVGQLGQAVLPGRSASRTIEALGPTFIKFGQALANRPDLVGAAIADDLRLLQDACAP